MNDIVRVCLEMETEGAPMFVASNLSNLPPSSHNSIDVLKLLQEIETMKTNIKLLTASQHDIVKMLQLNSPISGSTINT